MPMEEPPDYLVIGHITKDLLPTGDSDGSGDSGYTVQAGGTATYSALTAQRLGLQAAIVTACAPEDESLLEAVREAGVWVHAIPSAATTTFRNVYDNKGRRTQIISAQATGLEWGDVPYEWRGAQIVHLGPVAEDLPADMPVRFPYCLLGVTPQGWMRSWDAQGRVTQSAWPIAEALRALPPNAFLILSIEDLGYKQDLLDYYVRLAPLVAVTQSSGEALIFYANKRVAVPACPAVSIDPTGAGDVFATALLVSYKETGDPIQAARFAHAAAACVIEGAGIQAIPDRAAVLRRLAECG